LGTDASKGIPLNDQQEEDRFQVVRSDYDAMAGIQVLPDPLPPNSNVSSVDFVRWGIWGWAVFDTKTTTGSRLLGYRRGKFGDVTDGLSNTIAIVERAGKPLDLLHGERRITFNNPDAVYPGQVGWSASNTFAWSINADRVGVNESNSSGIYSLHPGGANVAIADGSVRFLADSVNFDVLVSLFGRSDGGLPE
jgi:prepilin-type processing-associated H-X9-DG protein